MLSSKLLKVGEHVDESAETSHARGLGRELIVLRARGRDFAVYAEEADGVAEGLSLTPLPHAPPPVVGVVCFRGRVRTVLDPAALPGAHEPSAGDAAPRFVVALRGDEQLGLAAEHVERLPEADAAPAPEPAAPPFARATLRRRERTITLLDPARLFDAAMQGAERRRPRAVTGDK